MTVITLNPIHSPNDPPMLENRPAAGTTASSVCVLVGASFDLKTYKG